jgi:hypothetical protein
MGYGYIVLTMRLPRLGCINITMIPVTAHFIYRRKNIGHKAKRNFHLFYDVNSEGPRNCSNCNMLVEYNPEYRWQASLSWQAAENRMEVPHQIYSPRWVFSFVFCEGDGSSITSRSNASLTHDHQKTATEALYLFS